MGVSKREIASWIEELAPGRYAEEWDNVGLQVGSLEGDTQSVLVGLTPDEELIRAAAQAGANMVVTHHPLIFKPVKSIVTGGGGLGRCIRQSILSDVTVFSCHTNFDVARGGVSDALAEALGLGGPPEDAPLKVTYEEPVSTHLERVDEVRPVGLGRCVELAEPTTLGGLAKTIKERLACSSVRVTGGMSTPIRTVGICGGSGADVIRGCFGRVDALITGDIKYHEALTALDSGLCLVDAGHHATEMPGVRALAAWLERRARAADADVRILVHEGSRDPFQFL